MENEKHPFTRKHVRNTFEGNNLPVEKKKWDNFCNSLTDDESMMVGADALALKQMLDSYKSGTSWEDSIPEQFREAAINSGLIKIVEEKPAEPRHKFSAEQAEKVFKMFKPPVEKGQWLAFCKGLEDDNGTLTTSEGSALSEMLQSYKSGTPFEEAIPDEFRDSAVNAGLIEPVPEQPKKKEGWEAVTADQFERADETPAVEIPKEGFKEEPLIPLEEFDERLTAVNSDEIIPGKSATIFKKPKGKSSLEADIDNYKPTSENFVSASDAVRKIVGEYIILKKEGSHMGWEDISKEHASTLVVDIAKRKRMCDDKINLSTIIEELSTDRSVIRATEKDPKKMVKQLCYAVGINPNSMKDRRFANVVKHNYQMLKEELQHDPEALKTIMEFASDVVDEQNTSKQIPQELKEMRSDYVPPLKERVIDGTKKFFRSLTQRRTRKKEQSVAKEVQPAEVYKAPEEQKPVDEIIEESLQIDEPTEPVVHNIDLFQIKDWCYENSGDLIEGIGLDRLDSEFELSLQSTGLVFKDGSVEIPDENYDDKWAELLENFQKNIEPLANPQPDEEVVAEIEEEDVPLEEVVQPEKKQVTQRIGKEDIQPQEDIQPGEDTQGAGKVQYDDKEIQEKVKDAILDKAPEEPAYTEVGIGNFSIVAYRNLETELGTGKIDNQTFETVLMEALAEQGLEATKNARFKITKSNSLPEIIVNVSRTVIQKYREAEKPYQETEDESEEVSAGIAENQDAPEAIPEELEKVLDEPVQLEPREKSEGESGKDTVNLPDYIAELESEKTKTGQFVEERENLAKERDIAKQKATTLQQQIIDLGKNMDVEGIYNAARFALNIDDTYKDIVLPENVSDLERERIVGNKKLHDLFKKGKGVSGEEKHLHMIEVAGAYLTREYTTIKLNEADQFEAARVIDEKLDNSQLRIGELSEKIEKMSEEGSENHLKMRAAQDYAGRIAKKYSKDTVKYQEEIDAREVKIVNLLAKNYGTLEKLKATEIARQKAEDERDYIQGEKDELEDEVVDLEEAVGELEEGLDTERREKASAQETAAQEIAEKNKYRRRSKLYAAALTVILGGAAIFGTIKAVQHYNLLNANKSAAQQIKEITKDYNNSVDKCLDMIAGKK